MTATRRLNAMSGWVPLLAQVNDLEAAAGPLPAGKSTSLLAGDAILIIFGGLCLTLLCVPWAVRIWRNTGRRHRKYKRVAAPDGPAGAPTQPATQPLFGKRHRERGQRPRNPTLAEVGGLPPLRPEGTPPPALP